MLNYNLSPADRLRMIDEALAAQEMNGNKEEINSSSNSPSKEEKLRLIDEALAQKDGSSSKKESKKDKSLWDSTKDFAEDVVVGAPRSFAKGIASLPDLVGYPVRKGLEYALGRDIPTLAEQVPKYEPKTMPGRIVNHAADFAGGMYGGVPIGKGASTVANSLSGATSQAGQYGKKGLDFISSLAGNPTTQKEVGTLAALGAGVGGTSQILQEGGVNPVVADVGTSLLFPWSLNKVNNWRTGKVIPSMGESEKDTAKALIERIEGGPPPPDGGGYPGAPSGSSGVVGGAKTSKVLENLQNYQAPYEGYVPTTAEAANNVGISQAQRSLEGNYSPLADVQEGGQSILRNELEGLAPAEGNISATQRHIEEVRNSKRAQAEAEIEAQREIARNQIEAERNEVANQLEHKEKSFESESENLLNTASKETEAAHQNLNKVLEEFTGDYDPEKTGQALREAVEDVLKAHKKKRSRETKPLYDALKNNKQEVSPQGTRDFINEQINELGVKDQLKNDLGMVEAALTPNSHSKSDKKSLKQIKEKYPDISEESMNETLQKFGIKGETPTAGELNNVVKLIDKKIAAAAKAGDGGRKKVLTDLKNTLMEDMAVVPEAAAARNAYHEHSKPINAIENDRALGKVVKKDIYGKEYVAGPAELPALFSDGTKSIQNTRKMMESLKNDKKTQQALTTHAREDFFRSITDANGNVSVAKAHTWLKNHPGVRILDPQFSKIAANVKKAKQLADEKALALKRTEKEVGKNTSAHAKQLTKAQVQAEKDLNKRLAESEKSLDGKLKSLDKDLNQDAFKAVLGKNNENVDLNKIVNRVLQDDKSVQIMKDIVELTKTDKSGRALEGLRSGVIKDLLNKIELGSLTSEGFANIGYHKLSKYMSKHKDVLREVLDPSQMKVLETIQSTLKSRHKVTTVARATASDTASNILNLITAEIPKRLINRIPVIGPLLQDVKTIAAQARASRNKQLFQRALVDPEYAKTLLTNFKDLTEDQVKRAMTARPTKAISVVNSIKNASGG